ncbi:hypothetical protein G6F61_011330 [Rhizopus arrhizus]|nr:hypothetical protein G6F61_011330 [Rhizopus arrhizus]
MVATQPAMMDTDLPILSEKPKKIRAKTKPLPIEYNIVSDVLQRKADITVGDLMIASPTIRRQLSSACKPKRITIQETDPKNTMALIEDEDINTTAVYSNVFIGDKNVKVLIDCGAAKTCISKPLADALGLAIDAASESVFTLGNGTKQPALGIIYDVPIGVENNLIIPCNVEVLPSCPTHLIIGNNWLNRAKAKIDFNHSTLKVIYKNRKAELEISFLRKSTPHPKMISFKENYQQPISQTNSKSSKHVHFEDRVNDEETNSDTESEEEDSSEEDYEEEEEEGEEEEESLLLLEDDATEKIIFINSKDKITLKSSECGLNIPANSTKIVHVKKPKNNTNNSLYNFELINDKLFKATGCFDSCVNLINNKKSLEVRIYNRGKEDIILDPDEEIGIIETFDPIQDTVIQSYGPALNPHLCVIENLYEEENGIPPQDSDAIPEKEYKKIEVGEIEEQIKLRLKKLLKKYEDIFDWNNDTIGHTALLEHKIIIKEDTIPISHRPYRISPLEADHLQKELEKYCKLGVISPSNSPWAAPVILVKKKNGEYRMVIDYRKLNAVTKKDAYPLPRIDDLLDTLGKAKVFSALDMRAGFHQVPVEENSKELTAFTTKFGIYHYNTLPMGLVNSPATFQRLIDLCFRPLINKCLVTYIDDLNVYSLNHTDHLHHLEQVFQYIRIANLKLNPEKCFFFKDQLKFLGYTVTKEGLQTDPSKIQKIIEYPQPKTIKQVRGFLGLASYYRRFIKNFAAIARPLHDQTKTTKKVPWTEKTTESFETLKKLLTSAPILIRPDFNKPFILTKTVMNIL